MVPARAWAREGTRPVVGAGMSYRETKIVRPPPPPPPADAGEGAASARTETLAALVEREGRLSVDSALALMQDVTTSLAEAHAAEWLHGDIQPANVLITPDGRAELINFPEVREGEEAAVLVSPRNKSGTEPRIPLYYPPEVSRGKRLDQLSDLFLLGATFYHALSGRPPFEHANPEDSALLYIRQEAPPLGQVAPGTSVALCCVIHKLLRRKPDERYQTATEVLDALDQIENVIRKTRAAVQRVPAPPPPPKKPEPEPEEPLTPAAERAAARQKQQTRLAIILGVAFLGVLAVAVLIMTRGGRRREAPTPPLAASLPARQTVVPVPPTPGPAPRTAAPAEAIPKATTAPISQRICLEAANAKLQGACRYEGQADKRCIGYWTGDDASATWDFTVERPGAFAIELVLAADQGAHGNEYIVSIGDRTVRGTVRATGSWTNFEAQMASNIINLPLPSTYTLTIRSAKKAPGSALMNLRGVNLVPVRK